MRLHIPLLVGTFSPQGEQALKGSRRTLPSSLRSFLTDYESGLDDNVRNDPRFEFRLRVTLEQSPKDPDAVAIQFTRLDDTTDEERATVAELRPNGRVVVRGNTSTSNSPRLRYSLSTSVISYSPRTEDSKFFATSTTELSSNSTTPPSSGWATQ